MAMLSTRIQSLQAELHVHRRWLSRFLSRTQASRSPFIQQHVLSGHAISERHAEHPRNFATKIQSPAARRFKLKNLTRREERAPPEVNPIVQDIRQKVLAGNIAHVIEDYNALNDRDKRTLKSRDVRQIAQCLHQSARKEKNSAANQHRPSNVRELVEFADVLVKDVKGGALVPSGRAHVHLLGIFKESGSRDKGVQFWEWLAEQGETYVDVDCYAAAIELLAYDGVPLPRLNKLYEEALGRFPGSFAAYHLSPDAILPDREQAFTVGGIPISLLQAILTARLLNGHTRDAYLALDTALRILPDQVPTRLFWLFLEERPLQEAYAVFALACRGGNTLSGAYYRSMLGALRARSSLRSPAEHALGLRAMLSVTYMFIGNGGAVAANSVNELVIAATQLLRVRGVEALSSKEKRKVVNETMDVVRGIFDIFARYGAKPGIPAFNSIITNIGGFGSSKQTIGVALKDADLLGLTPTDVTWRSILAVAGMSHDRGLVEKTWGYLRDTRIEAEANPQASDFHALVKPAHLSGAVEFAREELEKFRDVLGGDEYETLLYRLEDPGETEVHSVEHVQPVDLVEMLAEIEQVKADIAIIKERTNGSPTVQDFSQQALPLTLQPTHSELSLPETHLRKLYDESTSNAAVEAASARDAFTSTPEAEPVLQSSPSSIAKSKTNVSFGVLRFESWNMINRLLELSEKTDLEYHQKVDEALAAGKVPPKRKAGLHSDNDEVVSWGLSSVAEKKGGAEESREVNVKELERVREKIVRLRNRHGTV